MPNFEITEVESEARTWTAKKGPAAGQEFKSYTVRAKGPDGEERTYEISRKPSSAPPSLGPVDADVQSSSGDFPDKLKLSYSGRQNGGSSGKDDYWQNKEQRDIESQARMGRAHAQEMALRVLGIYGPPLEGHVAIKAALTEWTDWFHADVQRFPVEADGGGADDSLSKQSPTAAAVGFASKKQKDYYERLLKQSVPASAQSTVTRYLEQAPSAIVHAAIDALKDKDTAAIDGLLLEATKWESALSDVPYDANA